MLQWLLLLCKSEMWYQPDKPKYVYWGTALLDHGSPISLSFATLHDVEEEEEEAPQANVTRRRSLGQGMRKERGHGGP